MMHQTTSQFIVCCLFLEYLHRSRFHVAAIMYNQKCNSCHVYPVFWVTRALRIEGTVERIECLRLSCMKLASSHSLVNVAFRPVANRTVSFLSPSESLVFVFIVYGIFFPSPGLDL